jgi:hypothetical protein
LLESVLVLVSVLVSLVLAVPLVKSVLIAATFDEIVVSCSSELKVASWVMNWVLSVGFVGSWFCNCVTSSWRKASSPRLLLEFELEVEVAVVFDVDDVPDVPSTAI